LFETLIDAYKGRILVLCE